MALYGNTLEQKIYNFLRSHGYSQTATAAIMGNLAAESGLQSNNLQNAYEGIYNDKTYTEAVDKNIYGNFANDSYGYGLAQWTSAGRKKGLLDYARSKGKSISDLETQLEYLVKELTGSYSSTNNYLRGNNSFNDMSTYFLKNFESPRDQSASVQAYRQSLGRQFLSLESSYNTDNVTTDSGSDWFAPARDTFIKAKSFFNKNSNTTDDNADTTEERSGFWAPVLNWLDNVKATISNAVGLVIWAIVCGLLAWYLLNVKE